MRERKLRTKETQVAREKTNSKSSENVRLENTYITSIVLNN